MPSLLAQNVWSEAAVNTMEAENSAKSRKKIRKNIWIAMFHQNVNKILHTASVLQGHSKMLYFSYLYIYNVK